MTFLKKSLACSTVEKQQWIEPDNRQLSIRKQCELLGINRASVYYKPRARVFSEEQLALLRLVDEVYTSYPFFGTRQMSSYIALHFHPCCRHEIRWAYEHLGLH